MTLFSRKMLTSTYSMKEQAAIRDKLSAHGIDYQVKVINRQCPFLFDSVRARTGTYGQNLDASCEYLFYVDRSDWEQAQFILRQD